MKFFEETTVWDSPKVQNHVYLLDDSKSKLFAYVRCGSHQVFEFCKPIQFDSRRRKFREVANRWNYRYAEPVTANPTWTVTGSRGDQYIVERTESGYTCTCSGFKFRGACKHSKQIEQQQR